MAAVMADNHDLARYLEHRSASIATGLHDPAIREGALGRLPAGVLQRVAIEALAVLKERARAEPWAAELVEEVAASIGRCGIGRWER